MVTYLVLRKDHIYHLIEADKMEETGKEVIFFDEFANIEAKYKLEDIDGYYQPLDKQFEKN